MCLWNPGVRQHERLQARVEDIRCNGVHQLHFHKLGRFDFVHAQTPAVYFAKIHLLPVLVEAIHWKERFAAAVILVEVASLREGCAVQEPLAVAVFRCRHE